MKDTAADRARRAAERRQRLTFRVVPRDAADQEDHEPPIPVADRLNAAWQLSVAAWAFAGQPIQPLRRDLVRVVPRHVWEAE